MTRIVVLMGCMVYLLLHKSGLKVNFFHLNVDIKPTI